MTILISTEIPRNRIAPHHRHITRKAVPWKGRSRPPAVTPQSTPPALTTPVLATYSKVAMATDWKRVLSDIPIWKPTVDYKCILRSSPVFYRGPQPKRGPRSSWSHHQQWLGAPCSPAAWTLSSQGWGSSQASTWTGLLSQNWLSQYLLPRVEVWEETF